MDSHSTTLLSDWRFTRGDVDGAEASDFDDSDWERVSVPHDWAIAGPFDQANDAQLVKVVQDGETRESLKLGRTGALPWVGVGWYRLKFTVPANTEHAELEFDGAARFKGVCNGDPTSTEPFVLPRMRAFHGELVLVVETGRSAGTARIEARSPGLHAAFVELDAILRGANDS